MRSNSYILILLNLHLKYSFEVPSLNNLINYEKSEEDNKVTFRLMEETPPYCFTLIEVFI